VRLEKPVRRDFTEYLYCDGDVHTPVRSMLRAKINETIEAVYVDVGDAVQKDQLLVKFRSTDIEAEIAARQAAYDEAKNNYQRYVQLLEKGVVSRDVVEARRTLMEAMSALLRRKQSEMKFTDIRAPIGNPAGEQDGRIRVETRYVEPGEYRSSGKELLTLVDLGEIEIRARVPETGVRCCAVEGKIDFRLEGEKTWRTGAIGRISPSTDNPNRFFEVFIETQNEKHNGAWLMRRGMYAEVRIPLREVKGGLAVSASALKRGAEERYVYVARSQTETVTVVEGNQDKKRGGLGARIETVRARLGKKQEVKTTTKEEEVWRAHRMDLATGLRSGGYVQIEEGVVADDDLIVSTPRDDLRDGARLKIKGEVE